MGRNITNLNGNIVAPGGDYPYGRVKNRPLGTVADEAMMGDVLQTFMRAGDLSGVEYSGDPDNDNNGFQYAEALGLEAWKEDAPPAVDIYSGATAAGASINYHRWRLVGRTLYWQLSVSGLTIAASPTEIIIRIPSGLNHIENMFVNTDGYYLVGMYNQREQVLIGTFTNNVAGGPGYDPGIVLSLTNLLAFTNGVADQGIDFAIVAETDRA